MILKIKFTNMEIKNRLRLLQDLAARLAVRRRELDAAVFPHGAARGEPSASAAGQRLVP
jgi:hypothetical protein